MKQIVIAVVVFFPMIVFSQVSIKAGVASGSRWNEAVNSQTLGKGFRVAAEKLVIPRFTLGLGISYLSFNPNKSVRVRYNSYSLLSTYYFNAKKLQPYIGTGIGYTKYADKTTITTGAGMNDAQSRYKNYGVIAPYLGVQYQIDKKKKAGLFFQVNADFVPVVNTQPIGFISVGAGVSYHFTAH